MKNCLFVEEEFEFFQQVTKSNYQWFNYQNQIFS